MNFVLLYDDPADRALIIRTLQGAFSEAAICEILGRPDFEAALAAHSAAVVITDSRVSWADGLSILQIARETSALIPVIMLTGSGNEELAVAAMKAGLSDYLPAQHLSRLPDVIRIALEQTRQQQEADRAIQQLRRSEERYRLISEVTSDFTFSTRFYSQEADQVEWVTDAFPRKIGYTVEELQQMGGWQPLIHPEDLPRLLDARERLLAGQTIEIEFRMIAKSGTILQLRSLCLPVWNEDHSQVIGARGVSRDIRESKQFEERLQETEVRFRVLVEKVPAIFYVAEPKADGKILYVNHRMEEILGFAASEWMNDSQLWMNHIHPDDLNMVLQTLEQSQAEHATFTSEYRMYRRDGQIVWLKDRADLVCDEAGRPLFLMGVALDITDRKQAEEERQHLHEEVSEARDRLKTLSHQLITTQEQERQHIARELHDQIGQALTVLKLNLQACYKKNLGADLKERVEESVRLIDTTIEQVRHLSLELRPSILDDLGLVSALRWYLDRQASRAGIAIQFIPSNQGSRLPAEIETTCFRVVQEALTNILRHAQAQNVFVELREEQHELHLHIRDDGTGFDLTASAGTLADNPRLGLLSMQERVQLAGGQFRIKSAPARGTEIQARFQLAQKS